mmetsp:Transcript_3465/g.8168  ORF Transcript_3465/g.8168 Transcript_3465/m.8168 type:complete len:323 (-) Transcript_3465:2378-3346(-)
MISPYYLMICLNKLIDIVGLIKDILMTLLDTEFKLVLIQCNNSINRNALFRKFIRIFCWNLTLATYSQHKTFYKETFSLSGHSPSASMTSRRINVSHFCNNIYLMTYNTYEDQMEKGAFDFQTCNASKFNSYSYSSIKSYCSIRIHHNSMKNDTVMFNFFKKYNSHQKKLFQNLNLSSYSNLNFFSYSRYGLFNPVFFNFLKSYSNKNIISYKTNPANVIPIRGDIEQNDKQRTLNVFYKKIFNIYIHLTCIKKELYKNIKDVKYLHDNNLKKLVYNSFCEHHKLKIFIKIKKQSNNITYDLVEYNAMLNGFLILNYIYLRK